MKEINALGKACPMPVIEAKKALGTEEGRDGIVISVDNEIATQNLAKLAEQMELSYSVSKQSEQEYRVAIGGEGQVPESVKSRLETGTGYVVAISSLEMGSGDSKLGKNLWEVFYTLYQNKMNYQRRSCFIMLECTSRWRNPIV